jgi:predicted AAA+ superfamily ATPase
MLQHIDITRTAYQKLDTWLDSKFRKPILVRGARQVGKSFTVRTWGQKKAAAGQFLEINFEEQPSLKSIFTKDLVIPRMLSSLLAKS